MLKTFLASTAIASTLGFAALAQDTSDPLVKQPGTETEAPADMAPAAPDPQAQDAEPSGPMAPAAETAQDPAAPGTMAPEAAPTQTLTPVLAADISVDSLKGATIETPDGRNIASVDDVLMAPDGSVQSIVAQFGGFLGFGSNKVLLTPDEIEVLQDQSGTYVVQTNLTPEALEGRPEYKAEQ